MSEADLLDFSKATAAFFKLNKKMPENILALKNTNKNTDWFDNADRKCKNTYGFASLDERWVFTSLGPDLLADSGDEIIVFGGRASDKLRDVRLVREATLSVKCI